MGRGISTSTFRVLFASADCETPEHRFLKIREGHANVGKLMSTSILDVACAEWWFPVHDDKLAHVRKFGGSSAALCLVPLSRLFLDNT